MRYPYLITSFFIFTGSLLGFSQTPCENNFAGEYPCQDYDLLANIPVSVLANEQGNPEGSDLWGWTDPLTNKEYAIAGMTNSTAFIEVTDPVNPVFLGRLDTNAGTSYWRDVKIYNNHAFIVADNVGAHGMQVFDLTKLRSVTTPPTTFTADAIFDEVGSCHNIVINETTAMAYLVGCNTFSGGLVFVDISDPVNPVGKGGYTEEGYTHDAQVVTYNGPDSAYVGKEILIGSNENKVVILDVSNKSNVLKIAEIGYEQIGYTHQGWFTEDHAYFIVGDETDEQNFGMNTRTLVFDFTDLDNPVLSNTYLGTTEAIDHNGYVKEDTFFMANYSAGMRVLDITNISASSNAMTEIGYFDTHPTSDAASFNGAWSVYPYFASGNIIINDIERGLFIVRKSGTLHTDELEISENFSVYPNPSAGSTTLQISSDKKITSIAIYNVLGKKVFYSDTIDQSKYVLSLQDFSKGLYLLKVNGTLTKKIILN